MTTVSTHGEAAKKCSAKDDLDVWEWLSEFNKKHGRPLRVLHIGNTANNAYVNAKIMRRAGMHADVLCPNYYHVMSCPEWEDLPELVDVGNPDLPDWWGAGVRYTRPRWFVQGPRRLCLKYLAALARGNTRRASLIWNILQIARWLRVRRHPLPRILFRLAHFTVRQVVNARQWRTLLAWLLRWLTTLMRNRSHYPSAISSCQADSGQANKLGLEPADVAAYQSLLASPEWRKLCEYYDIIQGYATEALLPLLSGVKGVAAYEHGTLRDIPFQNDIQGRLCAATYRAAPAVFITNTDCVAAADRLGIPKDRQYPIPHGFDSDRTFSFYDEWRPQQLVKRNPPQFFAPARHHWVTGNTSWRKGNDVIVHAAKRLAERNIPFKVIFVEWGKEVDKTRHLIRDLGLEERFEWVRPMSKPALWKTYLASVGVIDQFVVPAMGAVSFETLALGRPLLTKLDLPVLAEFFGAAPPMYNVHDPESLALAMERIVKYPQEAEEIGLQARQWTEQYHSSERILQTHLRAYRSIIDSADAR